jgi:DNA-binding PucR family transcriptional regulator
MAVVADAGDPLSPQAADLVRRIARVFLDEPADLMAEVHAAVSAAADEPLRSEPTLAAEVAASTRANVLHWAAGIARDPGGRVPANLTPEVLGIAREAFRRGIEQTVYTTYHAGQNAVQAYWMRTAFALSADPEVLRQALAAGSRSLAGFVDDMVAALFVARTLGQLADADPDLRDTLCVYIGEQFSAARAARALYTHRNTVLNRLHRAERLLPLPLAGHGLEVGVALEIAQWLGTQPGSATHPG